MKMMHICICSGFNKHGRILLKFGMQVNINYGIIENENRVKNPTKIKNIFILETWIDSFETWCAG
jgi:hypothetical protein